MPFKRKATSWPITMTFNSPAKGKTQLYPAGKRVLANKNVLNFLKFALYVCIGGENRYLKNNNKLPAKH